MELGLQVMTLILLRNELVRLEVLVNVLSYTSKLSVEL